MKLTIRRNQADVKGLFGGHKGVSFALSGQVSVSDGERALIERYKVNDHILAEYQKQRGAEVVTFQVSVRDLMYGKSVETNSIGTLLDLEDKLKEGCQNLKTLLEVMATFGGEEILEV
jgi:hypothetical protein